MCGGGGSPKVDNSIQKEQLRLAEEARAEEEARKQRILEGTAKVEDTFGMFGNGYWDERKGKFLDYYNPQLDDQFAKAQDDLTFGFARRGTLNSTAAADKQAELTNQYKTEQASILSQAIADRSSAQGQVNNEKSALIAQLNATGNADQISNQALSRSNQLFQQAPAYNSLGDVFGALTSSVGNFQKGVQQANYVNGYQSGYSPRGASSTTVIG